MPRTYRKTFVCSDVFPTWRDDSWDVMESGRLAERWTVVHKSSKSFTVEIIEFIRPSSD